MWPQAGGTIKRRRLRVQQIEELAGYDLIVNCSGLHCAKKLFMDDKVYPIREQVRPPSAHT